MAASAEQCLEIVALRGLLALGVVMQTERNALGQLADFHLKRGKHSGVAAFQVEAADLFGVNM